MPEIKGNRSRIVRQDSLKHLFPVKCCVPVDILEMVFRANSIAQLYTKINQKQAKKLHHYKKKYHSWSSFNRYMSLTVYHMIPYAWLSPFTNFQPPDLINSYLIWDCQDAFCYSFQYSDSRQENNNGLYTKMYLKNPKIYQKGKEKKDKESVNQPSGGSLTGKQCPLQLLSLLLKSLKWNPKTTRYKGKKHS